MKKNELHHFFKVLENRKIYEDCLQYYKFGEPMFYSTINTISYYHGRVGEELHKLINSKK